MQFIAIMAILISQPSVPDNGPPAVPGPPSVPMVEPESTVIPTPKATTVLTYGEGVEQALADGSPLFTFVGIPSKPRYGVVCEIDHLPGYPAKCIVVSQPKDGAMYWYETLDKDGKLIERVKEVSREANPFPRQAVQQRQVQQRAASC